jgi:hypothetical protein
LAAFQIAAFTLQAINLNNELDRRRQEKRTKPRQPVLRKKMAAQKNTSKIISKIGKGNFIQVYA